MLKIWKMAADFQNVYRYYVCLCSSVVLADVLEHNCNPAGENWITFCGRFLSHSSVLPSELHRGKKCGCWLLVSLTKCGCCSSLKEAIVAFSKKKKTISKSSDKTSSTRGSSDATMFLVDMICTQTPAHWNPKILIKWYGSIYFVSLVEKKCSSICPEKNHRKFHSNGKRSRSLNNYVTYRVGYLCWQYNTEYSYLHVQKIQ